MDLKKYTRSLVHAAYVLASGAVLFATSDSGRAFIEHHPAVAAAVPVLVAAFRAIETATGKKT